MAAPKNIQQLTCLPQLQQKVAKLAGKTHKERVQQFNEKLVSTRDGLSQFERVLTSLQESLSEHHDIPKVGPG